MPDEKADVALEITMPITNSRRKLSIIRQDIALSLTVKFVS
jgi:hypothetical protein